MQRKSLSLLRKSSSSPTAKAAAGDKKRVIVIGAGFAGLSVAYHLHNEAHFEVIILEARDRIGGRVWSYDGLTVDTDPSEVRVDLGGQWIHEASPANPIRRLTKELNVPLEKVANKRASRQKRNTVFDQDGSPMDESILRRAKREFQNACRRRGLSKNVVIDEHTSVQNILDIYELFEETTSLEERGSIVYNRAMLCLMNGLEMYEGGRLRELSVSLEDMYQGFGGTDEVVKGGYGTLLDKLVEIIGKDKIRLESVAQIIKYHASSLAEDDHEERRVAVHLADGQVVTGDFCICTASLGLLQNRRIDFVPDLPPARWCTIDNMGMGLLNKVAIRFPHKFWSEDKHCSFTVANEDPSRIKVFYDQSLVTGVPILLMFHGGDGARRVDPDVKNKNQVQDRHSDQADTQDAITEAECIEEALEALRAVFGKDAVPPPVASIVTRWNQDEYALGSYSFAKVNCTESMFDMLAMPIGNLGFAGEATCKTSYGCVHGAWLSGEREAKRILQQSL